jgi:hypothetical protein
MECLFAWIVLVSNEPSLGAHRTLGPSVTRVRSTNIDGWY